jgi:hypothetical protein
MKGRDGFQLHGRTNAPGTTPVTLRLVDVDEYDDLMERHAEERYAHERALDIRDRHLPEAA